MEPASESPISAAWRANRKHWKWFLAILGAELWLAYSIPPHILSDYPGLRYFVDAVATIAPVVHNLDRVAPHPEALSLFFAITTLLILPKTAFFFLWLNSSRIGMYRHFVISPLTLTTPKRPDTFITEPIHEGRKQEETQRSLSGRIFLSLVILVLFGVLSWFTLMFGWDADKGA